MAIRYMTGSLLFFLLLTGTGNAQQLSFPAILALTDLPADQLDSSLRQQQFLLHTREEDSLSGSRYYTSIERHVDDPTWIRSVTVTDVVHGGATARLVKYRTYNSDEYTSLLSWLLEHQFRTTNVFHFGEATHTLYSDGQLTVRFIVSRAQLPDKRRVRVYELEVGH